MIKLIIDYRENLLYNNIIERDLDQYKDFISIDKKNLELGDIHIDITTKDYTNTLIFERKTLSDLNSSIGSVITQFNWLSNELLNYRTNPFGVEYVFSLDDAIYECPEYLVNLDVLRNLALEYDLVMESHKTFDYLYHTNKIKHKDLINKMKLHRNLIPDNQYEVCCLYISVVFKKRFKNV